MSLENGTAFSDRTDGILEKEHILLLYYYLFYKSELPLEREKVRGRT